jgi:hypothetical protein
MTLTQLNKNFDSIFAKQSAAPKDYGKFVIDKEVTFEGRYKDGIYSLTCLVGRTRRVKYAGTNAPAEFPWNAELLTAYFVGKMDTLFNALTVAQQALFAAEYVSVKDFIARGKLDVAKQIVTNTAVTSDLQKTKDAIVAYLS